jgi:hypothetical protein
MKIKDLIKRLAAPVALSSKNEEENIERFRHQIREVKFQFREGFTDRVVAKLNNLREIDPLEIYYKNLSGLFPKIVGFSFAAILVMGIVLFVLHGNLSPDKLFGADRVDENNFITYLIIQK